MEIQLAISEAAIEEIKRLHINNFRRLVFDIFVSRVFNTYTINLGNIYGYLNIWHQVLITKMKEPNGELKSFQLDTENPTKFLKDLTYQTI